MEAALKYFILKKLPVTTLFTCWSFLLQAWCHILTITFFLSYSLCLTLENVSVIKGSNLWKKYRLNIIKIPENIMILYIFIHPILPTRGLRASTEIITSSVGLMRCSLFYFAIIILMLLRKNEKGSCCREISHWMCVRISQLHSLLLSVKT